MAKDTAKLLEELKGFSDFKQYMTENKEEMGDSCVSEYLQKLIEEKGLNKAEIIKNAELDETYGYQIISGIKKAPSRNKVISLAIGMGLGLSETQDMLKATGYAPLYAKREFDAIVIYGFYNGLGVVEINNMLFEYLEETL
ncbi:MAG: XRE family transcriptional regulator [Clostridia bacterium]|nr:XRE family transcriptional regulator [Clostridia bacterium]